MDVFESIKRLPFGVLDSIDCAANQQKLVDAARAFLSMDEKRAEEIAREIFAHEHDADTKNMAVSLLFALLLWQDRYDEMAPLGLPRDDDDSEAIMVYDPRELIIKLSPATVEHKMPQTIGNLPAVQVRINDVDVVLLIDTGAMISTVTESMAKRCALMAGETALEADNPFGSSVTTQLAYANMLNIGGHEFIHKPFIVIPDAALDFHDQFPDLPPIFGTIGWEVIRKLKWTIDFKNRTVLIESPVHRRVAPNMCCDFFPMVRVEIDNKSMVLGLDTGATTTHFGMSMTSCFGGLAQTTKAGGGVGVAHCEEKGSAIPELLLLVEGTEIVLENAWVYSDREYSMSNTFILPGILGSDIAKNASLVIDYANRHLAVMG